MPKGIPRKPRPSPEVRFWTKVGPPNEHGCREWTDACDPDGYGVFSITTDAKRQFRAHRLAWIFTYGEPPPEKPCVLHRCDNRPCCETTHLFVGTNKENTDDMVAKGRSLRGERNPHPNVRLTEDDVRAIRRLLAWDTTHLELAQHYGVKPAAISKIATGRTWSHVV